LKVVIFVIDFLLVVSVGPTTVFKMLAWRDGPNNQSMQHQILLAWNLKLYQGFQVAASRVQCDMRGNSEPAPCPY
jgi:hypothetical protein